MITVMFFLHSLLENNDNTQMHKNLLKFYVYSNKNPKHHFSEAREAFFRKNLHKRNKIAKYVK